VSDYSDTKSADGETTLLHYLVKLVNSKYPEAVNWGRELKNVPIAARSTYFTLTRTSALATSHTTSTDCMFATVVLSSVQSNLAQMNQGFKAVERELPFSSEDPSDPFLRQMTEFMFRKEDFDQLHADSKTMEVLPFSPYQSGCVWWRVACASVRVRCVCRSVALLSLVT
jgi:hypothetical protein